MGGMTGVTVEITCCLASDAHGKPEWNRREAGKNDHIAFVNHWIYLRRQRTSKATRPSPAMHTPWQNTLKNDESGNEGARGIAKQH